MTTPQRHAPRGPVKSHGPIKATTHEAVKCTAHSSRTGKPCQRAPIAGGTVCGTHGGAAPQVKQAAMERLRALQHPAVDALDWLLKQRDFPSAAMSAARDVLDRTEGKAMESVDMHVTGAVDIIGILRSRHARRNDQKAPPDAPSPQAGHQ